MCVWGGGVGSWGSGYGGGQAGCERRIGFWEIHQKKSGVGWGVGSGVRVRFGGSG